MNARRIIPFLGIVLTIPNVSAAPLYSLRSQP